jgi:hypothetical protein
LLGRIHRSLRALTATPERRLLLIALGVRLVPAAFVFGSHDVAGSLAWGDALVHGASPYASRFAIVWPPLWLPFAAIASAVADATWLPPQLALKSIPIACDVVTTFLLYDAAAEWRLPPMRTALLYALNPVAIYACALHGNFDAIPAMCALQAVILAQRGEGRAAAAWLGAGAAFKTWPLFLLPALVAPLASWRRRAEAAAIAIGIFAAALLIPMPFEGWHVITDALGYRGSAGWWGLTSIAFLAHAPIPSTAIFYATMTAAALFLFVRPLPPARGALILLLTFAATTPGFGPQYLVWLVPIALLADPRRAVVYSAVAGAVLAWEILMRPYTGHPGDMFRILPHTGFARAYGGTADHVRTALDRLVVWGFVCYWWLAAIARARRDGSSGPS